MNKLFYAALLFLLAACNRVKETPENTSWSLNGDTIIVKQGSILAGRIVTLQAEAGAYSPKLTVPGIVRAIPNNYAEVASPFAGRITRSFVRLGQHVKVDAPIFEISSSAFFEAGTNYYRTKQEMQLAEKNLRRQKDLLANGVGVEKEMEEAEVAWELARRDYENSVASLGIFHVRPEEVVLGQPLIVRAPVAGEIVDNKIVIGQYLREDAGPVAIVAELGKVWVAGQIKEKDINSVHESDEVEISLPGNADSHIKGTVYHISEILDEETRSVQVYVVCDNSSRTLKPGMYVTTQFCEKKESLVLIPSPAVFQSDKSSFVFIETGRDRYMRRPVTLAGTDGSMTIIGAGLEGGEKYVSEGGAYLLDAR